MAIKTRRRNDFLYAKRKSIIMVAIEVYEKRCRVQVFWRAKNAHKIHIQFSTVNSERESALQRRF